MSWAHDHKTAEQLQEMADVAEFLHGKVVKIHKWFKEFRDDGEISDEPDGYFDELLDALKAEKKAAEDATPIDADRRLTAVG